MDHHSCAKLFSQIIKALNLYRKKTGSDKYFWVKAMSHLHFMVAWSLKFCTFNYLLCYSRCRFIWIKRCLQGLGLAAEVATLQLLCGQQINLVVVLPLRRSFKNGLVKSVLTFPSFSQMERPIVQAEVRYVSTFYHNKI